MAHMLTTTANGDAALAFKGARTGIWHSLGQQMPDAATVEEMAAAGGFDFRIMANKVRYNNGTENAVYPGMKALFHSRTPAPIGLVGEGFQVAQPSGADALNDALNDAQLDTSCPMCGREGACRDCERNGM